MQYNYIIIIMCKSLNQIGQKEVKISLKQKMPNFLEAISVSKNVPVLTFLHWSPTTFLDLQDIRISSLGNSSAHEKFRDKRRSQCCLVVHHQSGKAKCGGALSYARRPFGTFGVRKLQ